MAKNRSKIWFSFSNEVLESDSASFYPKNNFDWVPKIENNWKIIRDEVQEYLDEDKNIEPYFNQRLIDQSKAWKSFALLSWGKKNAGNIKRCSKTYQLINQIEGCVSVSVSILEPGAEIKPHIGDTNAIVRCHLGLTVPSKLPNCGIQVGEVQGSWQEGGVLIFEDAVKHSAWNTTDKVRVVLIFDVLKKEFRNHKHYVCSTVLSKLLLQRLAIKFSWIRKLPKQLIRNNWIKFNAIFINLWLRLH